MNIIFNGKEISVSNNELLKIIKEVEPHNDCFAVAVNDTFVPKTHYADTRLKHGDSLELVSPMQGG